MTCLFQPFELPLQLRGAALNMQPVVNNDEVANLIGLANVKFQSSPLSTLSDLPLTITH